MKTLSIFVTIVVASLLLCAARAAHADSALAQRLRQLPSSIGEDKLIEVQPGETWVDMGEREHVGYNHLQRVNPGGFNAGKVYIAGRHNLSKTLCNGILINIPEQTLFYFDHGQVMHWYPVSVGMVDPQWHTITGNFSVGAKEPNPTWRKPDFAGGGVMPPGPDNPLGDRLIDLSIPYYGLHSTNNPACIGKLVSHGCIRMFPSDMHELFDLVRVGTPLSITYDTVKVGQQNGIVYLAIFPDIYNEGTNTPDQVRAELAPFGLSEAVSDAWLQKYLPRADGDARPILGSTLSTVINGAPWQGPIAPTLRDGISYLPLDALAAATGVSVTVSSGQATLSYKGHSTTLPLNAQTAFTALDTQFIAVAAYAKALGGSANLNGNALTISIPK